jgi:hypothetical protein
MTLDGARSLKRLRIRCGAWLCVATLLLAPSTRARQRLEVASPISGGTSFSRNIDLPPKRVSRAPLLALAAVVMLAVDDTVRTPQPSPLQRVKPLRSPDLPPSRPLRAPPSTAVA